MPKTALAYSNLKFTSEIVIFCSGPDGYDAV
jgi:hypothetical protein